MMMRSTRSEFRGRRNGFPPSGVVFLLVAAALVGAPAAGTAAADDAVTLHMATQASCTLGPGESRPEALRLALFRARRKAAFLAADRFEQQRLIQFVDKDRRELVHLVADALPSGQTEEQCREEKTGTVCTVRLSTTVRLSDFVQARLVSLRMGAREDAAGYRDEMEPAVPMPVRPGQALAKAYRLIDKKELRMAIIYLDRLAEHYPNWWEIYDIKALALRLQDQPAKMLEALRKACELGGATACAELE